MPAATSFALEDRPRSDLMRELRWYLEEFPAFPYASDAERARSVLEGLRTWGERAFRSLFGSPEGRRLLDGAARDGLGRLRLQIRSDDPGVLSWPWEALHDPDESGPLGQRAWIERSLEIQGGLPAAPERPERIDLLLVSPRPLPQDVGYRRISRPLLETVRSLGLAVRVHVLRPPAFKHLREHLAERPGFYHVLHFDGHGVYAGDALAGARRGFLYFEGAAGKELIPGEDLGALLQAAGVPLVVLNACQSAQVDDGAQTAFASVAAALVQGGARSVVAMAYTLTVSGAEQFVPAFYRRLFETGNVAEAVRAGRQRMAEIPSRVGAGGRLDLSDWIVPVLYRREGAELSLPVLGEAAESQDPAAAGFVDRDDALLWLERGLLDQRAGQLVHGLAGVGKTALGKEFVEWLRDTDGIGEGAVWLDCRNVRTAHDLFAPVGKALGGEVLAAPQIVDLLRQRRLLLVWDGLEGDALADEERQQLRGLLHELQGGAARVLLTSRGEAAWLGDEIRRLALTGLEGEDRWRLCEQILAEQGQEADLLDPDLTALVERLDGHPLALRAVLSELPKRGARELLRDLESGGGAADQGPLAALSLIERALPEDLRPLLTALSLFQGDVNARVLAHLARTASPALTPERITQCLETLARSGLVVRLGTHVYDVHPTVAGFLRANRRTEPAWEEAFVATQEQVAREVMGNPKISFKPYRADLRGALEVSRRQGRPSRLLLSVLAAGASELSDFGEAVALSAELAELAAKEGNALQESAAACEVGDLLRLQGDVEGAARWLQRAAEVAERSGDALGAADAHLQLASLAWKALDYDAAEQSARRSLAFSEKAGDSAGIAKACLELGLIAGLRKDFGEARRWFKRALDLRTRQGSRTGVARIHHELGILALHEGDLDEAEAQTRRALTVYLGTGDPADIGGSYHQLGRIAEERGDLPAAEEHYRRSLQAKEAAGDVREIGLTSRQLGVIAERADDLETADLWFRRAREVLAPLADPLRYAVACDLGRVAEAQRDLTAAERWYREALGLLEAAGDSESAAKVREHLEGLFDRVAHVEGSFFYMKEMIFGESAPSPLRDRLRRLDDRSALVLLARETAPLAEKEGVETEANEEVLWTLVDVFGFPDDMPSPSDADLARVALSALAEDPPAAEALNSALAFPLESAGEHLPVMTGALLAMQHYAELRREKGVLNVTVIMRGDAQFAALQELTHALLLRAEEGQPGLILRLRQRAHAVLQKIRSERL